MAETQSAPSLREWVMVPREATSEQLYAGQKAWHADPERKSSTLYRAMVEAAPPTTQSEAVASARAEGWQPIETLPYEPDRDLDLDLPGDADEGLGHATSSDTGEIVYLIWWTSTRPGRSKATHWRLPPAPPTTPGGRTDG